MEYVAKAARGQVYIWKVAIGRGHRRKVKRSTCQIGKIMIEWLGYAQGRAIEDERKSKKGEYSYVRTFKVCEY